MELHTNGLELVLRAAGVVDAEGWVRVDVRVTVNGFTGGYVAWLQLEDIARFIGELKSMESSLGTPAQAVLASAEPDILIELNSSKLGHITGRYALESERRDGVPTALTGQFDLDQSYLLSMQRDLSRLVVELSGASL